MRTIPRLSRRGIMLGTVALAAATGLLAKRRLDRENAPLTDSPADIAKRDAAIRRLRFAFVPFEAGAPSVDWLTPFGSADALADLASLSGDHLRGLYVAAMNALPAYVAATAPRLAPGRYRLDAADAAQLRARFELANLSGAPKDFGVAADDTFVYTAEHAAILPRLRWIRDFDTYDAPLQPREVAPTRESDILHWPVVFGNFKRPYGDMTSAPIDLADALGIKVVADANGRAWVPEETEARLVALHQTTPAALRVLVLHGER